MSTSDQQARLATAMHLRRQIREIPQDDIRRMFQYDRRLLPNAYLAAFDADVANVEDAMARTGISPGYPSWNLLYYCLLSSLRPDAVVVEVGTHKGFSTILLAQAIKDRGLGGSVWTVDMNPHLVEQAKRNVTEAGLASYVHFNVDESSRFLSSFQEISDHIDFAFVDGDHSEAQVLREFANLLPFITRGAGTIFFDNAGTGGVATAIKSIRKEHGGNTVEFLNCSWGPHGNVIWQP